MAHEYIARISYGKDSLKMLEVIHSRGLPLDRITTTDVWATDTISANLPPMEEFKARMDERIWQLYRIQVEHLCARNKDGTKKTYEQMFYHVPVRRSQSVQVERERENRVKPGAILGFPDLWNPWCQAGLKRNARTPGARNYHRLSPEHPVQLVSETQTLHREPSRGGRYPTKGSHGVSTSRSGPSPRFPMSPPRRAGIEISWNTWGLPPMNRNAMDS